MDFQQRLYEMRKQSSLSQEGLASLLGVTRQAVQKWESGSSRPDMDNLAALARYFNVSLDYLVTGQERTAPPPAATTIIHNHYSRWHYEYKSSRTLFGLPLIHIRLGERGLCTARGIIAIGNCAVGALSIGALLARHQQAVNLVSGLVVIFFGLNFLGVFRLSLFRGAKGFSVRHDMGFFSAVVFGAVFAVGWTPCVGAFLGSALMLASQQGSTLRGIVLLLCYSAGLGIPFLVSALLIQSLKTAFDWVKRHYSIINAVSGCLLVVVGILMATGTMGTLLSRLV